MTPPPKKTPKITNNSHLHQLNKNTECFLKKAHQV